MNNTDTKYAIKCKDKFVYYYGDDYMYGDISLVDFNVLFTEIFYHDKELAEHQLDFIKKNFSKIQGSDHIDVLEVMDMEVVELKVTYEFV